MHWLALRPSKIEEEKGFDETEHNVRRKVDEVKVQKMELPKLKDDSKWRKIDFKVPAPSLPIDPATGEVVSAGQQQHGAAEAGTLL